MENKNKVGHDVQSSLNETSTLNEWRERCHAVAVEKGWWRKVRPLSDIIALIHSEASEWFEAYRKDELDKPCDKGIPLTCQEEEIADLFIRLFDYCGHANIDTEKVVRVKLEYNKTRPYRHGHKKA